MKFDFQELEAYLSGYWLSDLANFSAFIYKNMPDLNWSGFYLDDGQKLRLGPFCGLPACFEIQYGKGVCGTSFTKKSSLIIADVDSFPGHIRCDSNSRSELVVPFYINNKIVGVFDLDSPSLNRFKKEDEILIEKALQILSKAISENTSHSFGKLFRDC